MHILKSHFLLLIHRETKASLTLRVHLYLVRTNRSSIQTGMSVWHIIKRYRYTYYIWNFKFLVIGFRLQLLLRATAISKVLISRILDFFFMTDLKRKAMHRKNNTITNDQPYYVYRAILSTLRYNKLTAIYIYVLFSSYKERQIKWIILVLAFIYIIPQIFY